MTTKARLVAMPIRETGRSSRPFKMPSTHRLFFYNRILASRNTASNAQRIAYGFPREADPGWFSAEIDRRIG